MYVCYIAAPRRVAIVIGERTAQPVYATFFFF